MVSYSSWNGKKMHGNRRLLTDVLKKELGFEGFLVSDWAAIDQLSSDYKAAIETSINAGLDMVMIPFGLGQKNSYVDFLRLLEELVRDGRVPQARIDDAVQRILTVKLRMNLFKRPFTDREQAAAIGSARHRQVARECVRQSLVLLKNERHALPLAKKAKRLHVAGAAADDLGIQCGGWTISWQGKSGKVIKGGTTLLEALRKACPDTQITYSADGAGAAGAEAAVVVVGEQPYAETKGDRKDLSLREADGALVHKVKEAGIPVITVLLSGRPLILGSVLQASDALVAAWLPGTEGAGVADVLVGDHKPAGKLPHTWPRSMDQIPCNVGAAIKGEPLFPYGFGLSY
jgi:beta-glucosidase